MLVYADRVEPSDARTFVAMLREKADSVRGARRGLERHARLVGLLIDAGRLMQGVADAGNRAATDAVANYLMIVARALVESVDTHFAAVGAIPDPPAMNDIDGVLRLREPEGFAFYAVYPESFIAAARKLQLAAPPYVIGIRSIGTSLAAVAAATLGARGFKTVRPSGDPFDRRVGIAAEIEREMLRAEHHFVIVDEGPGLSGSSFGAVADWLQERGVPLERIAFVPSHANGPGSQASEAHRDIWRRVQRSPALFDEAWLADLFGPLTKLDVGSSLSFAAWRNGEHVLLKFAGLGDAGARKYAMASALHQAGWTAEPLALAHGFLVERWCSGTAPESRPSIAELAAYIGTRARLFPATETAGASVQHLFEMMRRNVELALGEQFVGALGCWEERLPALASKVARTRTDNRMDASKWLRSPSGRMIKTDALDHWCAHDLIGAQDPSWDVAGAAIELALDREETAQLAKETSRVAGRAIDAELIDFSTVAYCAFRLGQARLMGRDARAARYERHLHDQLPQQSDDRNWRETALVR